MWIRSGAGLINLDRCEALRIYCTETDAYLYAYPDISDDGNICQLYGNKDKKIVISLIDEIQAAIEGGIKVYSVEKFALKHSEDDSQGNRK